MSFKDQLQQVKDSLEFSEQTKNYSNNVDFRENEVEKFIYKKSEETIIISNDSEFCQQKLKRILLILT